ncbi:MAG: 2-C-methyl-D-erythritol 4-phosphate cytidylyltransferase [Desulfovibrio sp.]|nr:2-C-methyl-D-erythritol 4-phosphate cytidylyltransferase [Desulfovibrio sp.]
MLAHPNLATTTHKTWALILAAGHGHRLAAALNGTSKQFLLWQNLPLFWHPALAISRSSVVDGVIFVFPPEELQLAQAMIRDARCRKDLGLPWFVTAGGELRQDSVRLGLEALPANARHVLVHDAARPFLQPNLVRRISAALNEGADGVIPVVPVTDTIKTIADGRVTGTLPRANLMSVQTPQGFALEVLREAHAYALKTRLTVTDDAALLEALGYEVRAIPGEDHNVKITRPEDLDRLHDTSPQEVRTGMGYDVHRFGQGHPLKLGGVPIPGTQEVVAHSDGDVLLHALIDAILGCACLDDIGTHFPDNDPRFEGISSAVLLHQALDMAHEAGFTPLHADMTVVAQSPRLTPYRNEIKKNVARLLSLPPDAVNLKATTEEHLGFTGRVEGIKAYAIVTATRAPYRETRPAE